MMLRCESLRKSFAGPEGEEAVTVLRGISFSVNRQETVAIAGPSGSGKSTLLHIIGTLDVPDQGSVFLDDNDLFGLSENDRARLRNSSIGFVFQFHHLLPQCSVLENILLPTLPRSSALSKKEAAERADYLLERTGLFPRRNYRPPRLSGGELQRASVARALINKPLLLLADEPTGSLDSATSEKLTRLLLDLNREEETALIVVTHSLELAACMERRYHLKNGKLEKDGR
ncbi:MAG: ABC transporter ATP-binding protein [Spirochaetales bacterium]|nr:ABC transporter ATP-binding protein [Spirochaetales bacterium]